MDRSNHYEAAFEAYLQEHRLCYVAVDETRRSVVGEERVKSLDFIVYGEEGSRLLVDVKGRRFPGGTAERPRRVWECWSTREDLDGLEHWQDRAGSGYEGLLLFSYHVLPSVELPENTQDLWTWRGPALSPACRGGDGVSPEHARAEPALGHRLVAARRLSPACPAAAPLPPRTRRHRRRSAHSDHEALNSGRPTGITWLAVAQGIG